MSHGISKIKFQKLIIPFLFLGTVMSSCHFFEKQVPDEEQLLQQRLKEIDTTKVSSYPSIAECDAITDSDLRKECFLSTITRLVQERLSADTIALMYPELDTIRVKVTIHADSRLEFEPQLPRDTVRYDRKKIDSVIKARLIGFPKIEPAQKEGVPVTSEFIMPVVIDVEN